MRIIRPRIFTLCILLIPAISLYAADLTVPKLDLLTTGNWNQDTNRVDLITTAETKIAISGGYKFGGSLSLGFFSEDLGYLDQDASDVVEETATPQEDVDGLANYLDNNTYLRFQGAELTYRELFGSSNNDLTFFVGESDSFASGDVFMTRFGSADITTRYKGNRYFKSGFDGIHTVNGTGLRIGSSWGTDRNQTDFYFYQDGYLGTGIYSADAWTAFNLETIKFETFLGTSFPQKSSGIYRAGFLFYYNPGTTGEFLAEIGIPKWTAGEAFEIGDFYFLFEPRIHIDPLTVILTLFWQPDYYLQSETTEGESADIHINFLFGDPLQSTISGGLETSFIVNTDYQSTDEDQFEIVTSPYISLGSPGISWNFACDVNLLPFHLETLVEGIIYIKAAF